MCTWKSDFSHQELLEVNGLRISADKCMVKLLKALNEAGIETVAHCCGHGNMHGNIALADGREILIARDYSQAREIEKLMGNNIHGS